MPVTINFTNEYIDNVINSNDLQTKKAFLLLWVQSNYTNGIRKFLAATPSQLKFILGLTDDVGSTLLNIAASYGYVEIVDLLLNAAAHTSDVVKVVNAANHKGVTPLHAAAEAGHKTIFFKLLQSRAELTSITKNGNTILHSAVRGGCLAIVGCILPDQKIDPNIRNSKGSTPLAEAVQKKGNNKVVEKLLQNNRVDSTIGNNNGKTPFEIAISNRQDRMIESFLEIAISNRQDEMIKSFFGIAIRNGQDRIIKLFLEVVIKNGQDEMIKSFLEFAISNGQEGLIQSFFDGANEQDRKVKSLQAHVNTIKLLRTPTTYSSSHVPPRLLLSQKSIVERRVSWSDSPVSGLSVNSGGLSKLFTDSPSTSVTTCSSSNEISNISIDSSTPPNASFSTPPNASSLFPESAFIAISPPGSPVVLNEQPITNRPAKRTLFTKNTIL